MLPFLPFLLVNSLIIGLIIVMLVMTANPLAIFGLMFLVQMPFVENDESHDEEQAQPMGFTANVK